MKQSSTVLSSFFFSFLFRDENDYRPPWERDLLHIYFPAHGISCFYLIFFSLLVDEQFILWTNCFIILHFYFGRNFFYLFISFNFFPSHWLSFETEFSPRDIYHWHYSPWIIEPTKWVSKRETRNYFDFFFFFFLIRILNNVQLFTIQHRFNKSFFFVSFVNNNKMYLSIVVMFLVGIFHIFFFFFWHRSKWKESRNRVLV